MYNISFIYLIADRVCEKVDCGKGSCMVNTSLPLSFACECESGWKRTQDEDDDLHATSFLPCVIPECKFLISVRLRQISTSETFLLYVSDNSDKFIKTTLLQVV